MIPAVDQDLIVVRAAISHQERLAERHVVVIAVEVPEVHLLELGRVVIHLFHLSHLPVLWNYRLVWLLLQVMFAFC